MSYEIIKSITFDEKNKRITTRAASNNVFPKSYDLWCPTDHGYDYEKWKEMLAGSLFGGMAQFQPSCKSRAKIAYDNVNAAFGLDSTKNGVWHQVERMFPYDLGFNRETKKWEYDEDMKQKYDEYRERWESAYLDELNRLIGAQTSTKQLPLEGVA